MSKGSKKHEAYSYAPVGKSRDYASDGIRDHSIFKLPSSDWQWLGAVTIVGAAVRLFRISQPTSVVFDEVQ